MQSEQPQQPEEWQMPQGAVPAAPYQPLPEEDVAVDAYGTPESYDQQDVAPSQDDAESRQEASAGVGDEGALVRWRGTEYVAQDYPVMWYVILGVVVIVLMALAVIFMRSFTFALLIPVMAAALVIYTRRPPGLNDYTISRKGLHINDQLYPFDAFKSFGVVTRGGMNSIVLVPRKRFQIAQTVYFPQEVGEAVVDMLAARLPMKEAKLDAIDRFLVRLRL